MIRSLQRKFILTAMLSLLILIMILIGGITVLGYCQMEANSDSMLTMLSGEEPKPDSRQGGPPRPVFGYQINPFGPFPAGSFTAHATKEGMIDFVRIAGIAALDEEGAAGIASEALERGKDAGKIGAYKYRITKTADGSQRMAFVDNSPQLRMLLDSLILACFVGFGCMILMFLLLLLLSKRIIRPFAANMEKQKQFVTNAGHEIKTPLAIIMANIDALELHQGESKYSVNIRSQAQRMSGLTKQLLLLAKADEHPSEYTPQPLDFNALVQSTVAAFTASAKQKNIAVQTELPDGILLPGSRAHFETLLGILMDNAIKYNRTDGRVAVSFTTEGRKGRLRITNTVEALPDASPDALFDRFYRGNTARTQKDGGYGIGLSAAKAIVQLLNGKISASYPSPKSVCFTVELPL